MFIVAGFQTNAFGFAFVIHLLQEEKLSVSSLRVMHLFSQWISEIPRSISIWPKLRWPGICVADAFAMGSHSGIGGFIAFPSGQCKWLSLPIHLDDFRNLNIPMHDNLQKDISLLETLAQVALLYIVAQFQPGYRMALRVPATVSIQCFEKVQGDIHVFFKQKYTYNARYVRNIK